MKYGIPADGTGTDTNDVVHPQVMGKPVWRVITIVDQERSPLHGRIPITSNEDRGRNSLVTARGFHTSLRMEAAHDGTAGQSAQALSLALGTLHQMSSLRSMIIRILFS